MKISQLKNNPHNPRVINKDIVHICLSCGKEFTDKKTCKSRTPKYCSSLCFGKSKKMHIKCQLCGKEIQNVHSVSLKHRKYCSRECQGKVRQGVELSKEWKIALSKGRKNSEKCKGENLYNWKGGKATELVRMGISRHKRRSVQNMPIDREFLVNLLKAQENKCFYCDNDLAEYKAIEHMTPLSRGGDNQKYNLVYACKSCNSKKRNKTMEEYAIETRNFHLVDKFDLIFPEALYGK